MKWALAAVLSATAHGQCVDGFCYGGTEATEDTAMLQTPTKRHEGNPVVQTSTQVTVVRLGETNNEFGGVQGVVLGGVSHGKFENDFDWKQLDTLTVPQCNEVCRDPRRSNQCYPIKWNNHYGPPCGIANPSNGCFNNQPTQTCALCTSAQPYCCLYEDLPICDEFVGSAPGPEPAALGLPSPQYGGIMGGVFGGYQHGHFDNDVNEQQLSTWGGPKCDQVCRDPRRSNQCYPIKWNGNFGPPCGIVTEGYGCFQNQPTQTCALCTPGPQPYCCPYHLLPICSWLLQTPADSQESNTVVQTSIETQVTGVRLGETNTDFGGVQGAVVGGVSHGKFENDFDWEQLDTLTVPQCNEVCRDPRRSNQCYPIKWNNHYGPPCGIANPSNGCFNNQPTQTCALCTSAQPYCCLYEDLPICDEFVGSAPGPEPAALGLPSPQYGGIMGGVFGGYQHGHFDNDVNEQQLSTWGGPKCDQVCRDPRRSNQCYPIKWNGNFGPPCGIVTEGYGCFQNQPTQTCALCTPGPQPYCCPYYLLPLCSWV